MWERREDLPGVGGRGVDDPGREMDRVVAAARARVDADEAEERDAEAIDQIRIDHGRLRLNDRLAERTGEVVTLQVRGIGAVQGRILAVGRDWLSQIGPAGRGFVSIAAIDRFGWAGSPGTGPAGSSPGAEPGDSSWKTVIRSLVAAGRPVSVSLVDGVCVRGRLVRCGDDHFDLVSEAAGGAGSGETIVIALRSLASIVVQ